MLLEGLGFRVVANFKIKKIHLMSEKTRTRNMEVEESISREHGYSG